MTDKWVIMASIGDVHEDTPFAVSFDEFSIALYRCGDEFYATDNICTHAHAYLTDGFQDGCTIECPLHAGCFDIRTGKAMTAPLTEDIRTYPVRLEGDDILVNLAP